MNGVATPLIEVALGADVWGRVVAEARTALPEEACGLLVGRVEEGRARITRAVPCENTAPVERREARFEIDPRRVIEEERTLRGSTEEVVGFYHSHPAGDPVPSDVDRGYMILWPEAVWLIVGNAGETGSPPLRAWVWDPSSPGRPREIRAARLKP